VNSSAAVMLGYSKEELRQLTLDDVLIKEETMANPVDFATLQTGASTIKQRKMRRKDGSVMETEVHTKRLFGGLFLASIRDLTERMEIQSQLEKEIALSGNIINSLPGLFYLIRKDGKQLRWNKQLEEASGYTAAEIANMTPLDFFEGNDVYDIFHAIERIFETGSAQVEAYLRTKDGRRLPYFFTGVAIRYAGEDCLLGMAIDLSKVKRLENELAKQKIAGQKKVMQAMIEAEEKEKAKLGLELHDNVNQILSVVRMYLSILNSEQQMEEVTLPKAMSLLNTAIEEIRHLSHSLAVGYTFETGLAGTLEDVVEKIGAAKDFTLHLVLPPDLDDRTNSSQKLTIYRIVQEQLNNIVKHAKASSVNVLISFRENAIHVKIEDNGKGFNPSKVKKGLGLNNIVNRAEALGGKTLIYSHPGKGTRVEVEIPL
jgi:PAS domain S-box-containing protein